MSDPTPATGRFGTNADAEAGHPVTPDPNPPTPGPDTDTAPGDVGDPGDRPGGIPRPGGTDIDTAPTTTTTGAEAADLATPAESRRTVAGDRPPAGSPRARIATAEPEVISEAPPEPAPEPEPPEAIERYAVGTHVVVDDPDNPGTLRYGLVLESGVPQGGRAAAYLVGWFDTTSALGAAGRRWSHEQVETTRERSERVNR
ncbi:MAG: hypothetical protein LC798_05265 [Chloroflexi bacterium]|nr:hypothetical protein [Chloroflexota bacterium]